MRFSLSNLHSYGPSPPAIRTSKSHFEGWQARRESNPQPPVLETGALPIELLAYSLALLVSRVLPAEAAELAQLEPLGRLLLVLRRAVVATLALGARHRDDVSHRDSLPARVRLRT